MGFLNNTNNEVILDAVLTKYGREKLSTTGKLDITKFALFDDEIDYILHSSVNPYDDRNYRDIAIRQIPILESALNASINLRCSLYGNGKIINTP
jgi:hypothetical protein